MSLNQTMWLQRAAKKLQAKKFKKMKRHHHGDEQLSLGVSLSQTKHRMRIIKLQPAVKVSFFKFQIFQFFLCLDLKRKKLHKLQKNFEYKISKGNEHNQFEMVKKHGVWALHFRKRLKEAGAFDLEIDGRPIDSKSENEVWQRPLQLRVHLQVT